MWGEWIWKNETIKCEQCWPTTVCKVLNEASGKSPERKTCMATTKKREGAHPAEREIERHLEKEHIAKQSCLEQLGILEDGV